MYFTTKNGVIYNPTIAAGEADYSPEEDCLAEGYREADYSPDEDYLEEAADFRCPTEENDTWNHSSLLQADNEFLLIAVACLAENFQELEAYTHQDFLLCKIYMMDVLDPGSSEEEREE